MRQTDVDKVEELQDNLSDLINDAVEIQNIVSSDINFDHDFDDEELEKELEQLNGDPSLWPEVRLSPSHSEETSSIDPSIPLLDPRSPIRRSEGVMVLA
jgi:hypothetical protein